MEHGVYPFQGELANSLSPAADLVLYAKEEHCIS